MLLEPVDEFEQRHPQCLADPSEFDEVEPPLARLVLGDEGLWLAERPGKVFLTEPGAEAKLTEDGLKRNLLGGVNALLHVSSQSDLTSHPKIGYSLLVVLEHYLMQPSLFPTTARREVAPFKTQLLKWVGNKQRFAHEIVSYFPARFGTYFEPFLGSGAVLATLAPDRAVASDVFRPLADIWAALGERPDQLKRWYAERCEQTQSESKEVVYERVKAAYNAGPNAADLLYLCRACYGGVVRFRKRDWYMSTPCGAHTPIPPESFARRVDEWRERCRNTRFLHSDFADVMATAREGDVVYCDPPYVDTQTILYGAQGFSLSRLFDAIGRCKARGVFVALSIDGTKQSGNRLCDVPIPDGLFETEASVNCGRSMLRRFQMAGLTLENEVVSDRLLLTHALPD